MAWSDWTYTRIQPSPRRSQHILGYDPDNIPPNALRILLNDDAELPNERAAEEFCRKYFSILDQQQNKACPTEMSVAVFFTESFDLTKRLISQNNRHIYVFDGLIQDILHDDSGELLGNSIINRERLGIGSPQRPTLVVTNLQNLAVEKRTQRGQRVEFAISKDPEAEHRLADEVEELKRFFRLAEEHHRLSHNPLIQEYQNIIGRSTLAHIEEFVGFLDDVPGRRTPILILGESGTGKEAVSRLIHRHDRGSRDPDLSRFQPVLINGISPGTLEGELFGVVSLSPSDYDSPDAKPIQGYIQKAANGSLFIDEIGDVPSSVQGGLLRFLQEGKVRPIGGHWEEIPDVRCIFATHKNLLDKNDTDMRNDFLYRIDGLTLRLPSLAERTEDHEALVDYYIADAGAHQKAQNDIPFSDELRNHLLELCRSGSFTGNIRQLRMYINRIVRVAGKGSQIGMKDNERALKFSLFKPGEA